MQLKYRLIPGLVFLLLLTVLSCMKIASANENIVAPHQEFASNVGKIFPDTIDIGNGNFVDGGRWEYDANTGFSVLFFLFKDNELAWLEKLNFWIKANEKSTFVVSLTEQDESNYQYQINTNLGVLTNITIPIEKLKLDPDTNDENSWLDADRIFRLAIVDISGHFGQTQGKQIVFFSNIDITVSRPSISSIRMDVDPTLNGTKEGSTAFSPSANANLFRMELEGTNILQLTDTPYYENHAHVSPDGKQIVFTTFTEDVNRDGMINESDMDAAEVGIVNLDGTNYHLLTKNKSADFGAVWSPDGKEILFTTNRFGQFDLATIGTDGGNFKMLTSTADAHETDPHWVGNTIVFNRWQPGNERSFPAIWKMNGDGSESVQLTWPKFDQPSQGFPLGDMDPKVSPDEKKIAFERHQNNIGNYGFGNFDIYVMNIDGTSLQNISLNSVAEAMPTWSPSSNKIAFWAVGDKLPGSPYLFMINPDGSGREKVPKPSLNFETEMPSWLSEQELIFSGKME